MHRNTMIVAGLALLASSSAFLIANQDTAQAPAPTAEIEGSGLTLRVDLSERQLYLMKGGEVSATFPVAIGAPSFPTPKGSYSIRRMVWNPRWVPPDAKWARKEVPREPGDPKNPMGKVKIFFREPDYYIHGTRAVDSLGQAESHGCIRMRNSDAVEIARMVMDSGGVGKPDSWFSRMINRVRSTQAVNLARPVGVTIVA